VTAIPVRLPAALADRYRIERELGAGGMATVYLAEDLRHDRKVAIKVLKPELAAVLGAERFVVEIKTTAALSHPHILPLFDSGTADGFLFYVMPYIKGETIREKLNRETQFGVDEAVRIAREVADALDYAHRNGVIHRDIKPENILLHDGRAMVMDFGIALAVSAAAGGRMTETGLSLGTPHYMSPEQATADKELSGRSDVYSLASVLYEMLSGNPPHMGASAQQIIMKIIAEPVQPVTAVRKNVPPNVATALEKALEKLPADRFESARAFAEALSDARFTATRAIATSPVTASAVVRFAPWGVAAALAVALVASLVARRPATPPPGPPMIFQLESAGDSIAPTGVAIAADGRDLVFAGRLRGQSMLYHRALGAAGVRPIPGTEGAGPIAAIRPDRSVIFWADRELREVRLDGGGATRFARVGNLPAGLSWDDRAGLVLGMLMFSTPNGLSRVSRGDTSVTAITEVAGMHHDPVILPSGEHAAFTSFGVGAQPTAIGVASLKDGTWERWEVSPPPSRIVGFTEGVLVYRSRNQLMAVAWDSRRQRPLGEPAPIPGLPEDIADAAVSLDGTLALVAAARRRYETVLVDASGSATTLLRDEPKAAQFIPRFGPGGGRVAFRTEFQGINDVRVLGLDGGVLQPLRFSADRGLQSIGWTMDGRIIVGSIPLPAFGSVTSGRGNERPYALRVRAQPADVSDSARIVFTYDEARVAGMDVSPDGRTIALVTVPLGAGLASDADILLARIDSPAPPRSFVSGAGDQTAPRFSPDGRWLAYASRESGRYEVYVRSTTGGGVAQVSDRGGGQPVWSADGKRLYYRSGSSIMVTDLAVTAGGGLGVRSHQRVFDGDIVGAESDRGATFDVDPRGRIIVARAIGDAATPIVLATGWIAELKAQMAARPR